MPTEKQLGNLSRAGRGRTKSPRVYVGCLPCSQGRYVADLQHANRWIETHWTRCPRTAMFSSRRSDVVLTPQTPSEDVAGQMTHPTLDEAAA